MKRSVNSPTKYNESYQIFALQDSRNSSSREIFGEKKKKKKKKEKKTMFTHGLTNTIISNLTFSKQYIFAIPPA